MHPTPTQHNQQILQTLIDGGARIAKLVLDQAEAAAQAATAATPPPSRPGALTLDQATIAYDRVARTVRRAIALLDHLRKPQPAPQPGPKPQDPVQARTTIIRTVEDAIHAAAHYENDRKTPARNDFADCRAELYTRIDRPEFDHEIATRPVQDIIEEIARDLQVWTRAGHHNPQRRTLPDLENLAARAARTPLPHPARAIEQLEPDIIPEPASLATRMAMDLAHLPDADLEPALKILCHQLDAQKPPRRSPSPSGLEARSASRPG